jgi:hypothetical protein
MINNHWLSITHHDSQPLAQHSTPLFTTTGSACVMLSQWLWIMDCYAVPEVVNRGVVFRASGRESWCAMLSQWMWIMVYLAEPVVVNRGVFYWASGCESWCAMLSQWLWIMVCYDELVVMNHGLVCWASRCESWCVMLRQWHHHWHGIPRHDSQTLAQHNTPWFTTTGSA